MTGSVLAPRRRPESNTVGKEILTVRIDYSFRSETVPNRANGRKKKGVKFISHSLRFTTLWMLPKFPDMRGL
jgi:hypothetical protein